MHMGAHTPWKLVHRRVLQFRAASVSTWLPYSSVLPSQVVRASIDFTNVRTARRGLPSLPSEGGVVTDTAKIWKRRVTEGDAQIVNHDQDSNNLLQAVDVAHHRLRRYEKSAIKDESNDRLVHSQSFDIHALHVKR